MPSDTVPARLPLLLQEGDGPSAAVSHPLLHLPQLWRSLTAAVPPQLLSPALVHSQIGFLFLRLSPDLC